MLACWSVKGGSGVTVVAALVAAALQRATQAAVTLADLDGDLPALLGMEEPPTGLHQWLSAGAGGTAESLDRLRVTGPNDIHLLGAGTPDLPGNVPMAAEATRLAMALDKGASRGISVVDCGTVRSTSTLEAGIVAQSTMSLLVLRPCYLALRRATAIPLHAHGIVLVEEAGRSLSGHDLEEVLHTPVVATLAWDAALARAADAGRLLTTRLRASRSLDRLATRLLEGEELS